MKRCENCANNESFSNRCRECEDESEWSLMQ